MSEHGKENAVSVEQSLHKRLQIFRYKNKVMLETIEKQQRIQKDNEKGFDKIAK